ncbi:MAG: TonB family protein [Chrysiogenetes bacterium]|nr:TonB family protein [Chrysiogenetes bacterium]
MDLGNGLYIDDVASIGPNDQLPDRVLDPMGYRTPETIAATVRRYNSGFKVLYNRLLRENPNVRAGSVRVIFSIDPTGLVHDVSILSSDFSDCPEFETELIKRIPRIKFAPVPGDSDSVVEFPLRFSPGTFRRFDSPATVQ